MVSCDQLKIDCYVNKMFQVSLRVSTKQKSIVDTHKLKEGNQCMPLQDINSQRKTAREEKKNKGTIKKPENK